MSESIPGAVNQGPSGHESRFAYRGTRCARAAGFTRGQADAYFDFLPGRDWSRYQWLCDSQTFELLDRSERQESRFVLADLPRHIEGFGFTLGVLRRTFRDHDPVHVEASEPVARLHDALKAFG